jgi:peptidoglycan/xylan/chitin deacetylase (PgdA/CDA1 family)
MRSIGGLCAALFSIKAITPLAAQAGQTCPAPNTLGVERTINIDTTGGPRFGSQHGDPGFLAPGEIVLTFDDGPSPASTRPILAALAVECTKATFFVVGEMAAAHPEVVREIALQGHTIGTHTWSHANLRRLPEGTMKAQIEAGFTGVQKAAGEPIAPFFRYPYLSSTLGTDAYLRSRDIGQFSIDIDSLDWRTRNAQSVVRRVMTELGTRGGRGIILMHDIQASTALAVPTLLAHVREKGFKVVHLRPTGSVQTLVVSRRPDRITAIFQRRRTLQAKNQQNDGGPAKWPPW